MLEEHHITKAEFRALKEQDDANCKELDTLREFYLCISSLLMTHKTLISFSPVIFWILVSNSLGSELEGLKNALAEKTDNAQSLENHLTVRMPSSFFFVILIDNNTSSKLNIYVYDM